MNEPQKIAVVFSLNRGYLDPFTVALGSLLITNDCSHLRFYILFDSSDEQELFENRVREVFERLSINDSPQPTFISIRAEDYATYSTSLTGSHMTYGKITALKMIQENWILCVDCDCLVLGDLQEIINQHRESLPCAAVIDRRCNTHSRDKYEVRGRGKDLHAAYFNAGVILYNRKGCDLDKLHRDFLESASQVTNASYDDQSYLNIIFKDQWHALEEKWNIQTTEVRPLEDGAPSRYGIIHFIGKRKPWLTTCANEANYLWHNFAQFFEVAPSVSKSELQRKYSKYRCLAKLEFMMRLYCGLFVALGKRRSKRIGRLEGFLSLRRNSKKINHWLKSIGICPPDDPLKLY